MLKGHPPGQDGLTLVELLIGVTLAAMLSIAILELVAREHRQTRYWQRLETLYRAAEDLTELMARDIARSGYRAGSWRSPPPPGHPFQPLHIGAAAGEPVASCLLYGYDRNRDGARGIGHGGRLGPGENRADQEGYGFRLHHGRLEIRLGGAIPDCSSGQWQGLSPPELEVRGLEFRLVRTCFDAAGRVLACQGAAARQAFQAIHLRLRLRHPDLPDPPVERTAWVVIPNPAPLQVAHR